MEEKKLKHLEFIQQNISRMAGNLFYLRGWIITLIAGVLVFLTQKDAGLFPFVFLILAIIIFWGYDAYFLGLERKYRNLYDEVRKMEESKIDFSMSISKFNVFKKNSMFYCAFSSTLIFFYGPLLLAVLYVILFLK
jgi:small-conductance mechanosensitive channel